MANAEAITKRVAINKANAQMVAIVAVASFLTIGSLVASKSILSQNIYQSRVISAKNKANKQLMANIYAYNNLTVAYEQFVSTNNNVIGGSSSGNGPKDGNNAKIVLDALPPAYDFPALTASVQNLLTQSGLQATSITGTDDQLNQQSNVSSPNPQPVSMPFSFTVSNTNYQGVSQLINTLRNSIRPIAIDTLDVTGGGNSITVSVSAHTYYQPGKNLSITKQEVK